MGFEPHTQRVAANFNLVPSARQRRVPFATTFEDSEPSSANPVNICPRRLGRPCRLRAQARKIDRYSKSVLLATLAA